MHIDQAFPSKYVKASDLQGKEHTVVISNCEVEDVGDERKLVLYFQGKTKGMICNKTNAMEIAEMYGQDTDGWIGKEIALYKARVPFQNRMVDAVRVKPPARRAVAPQREHVVEKRNGYELSTTQAKSDDGLNDDLPPGF